MKFNKNYTSVTLTRNCFIFGLESLVWNSWFVVFGLGSLVWDFSFWVFGLGALVEDLQFGIFGLRFWVWDLRFRIIGLEFLVWDLRFAMFSFGILGLDLLCLESSDWYLWVGIFHLRPEARGTGWPRWGNRRARCDLPGY